jgi:hypothetical protein
MECLGCIAGIPLIETPGKQWRNFYFFWGKVPFNWVKVSSFFEGIATRSVTIV